MSLPHYHIAYCKAYELFAWRVEGIFRNRSKSGVWSSLLLSSLSMRNQKPLQPLSR